MVQKLQFLICKKYSEEWSTAKNSNLSKVQWFKCTSTVIPLYIFAVQSQRAAHWKKKAIFVHN